MHLREKIIGFTSLEKTINQFLKNILEQQFQVVSALPIPIEPYYIDTRMSAQESKFFIWGNTPVGFERIFANGDYISLESISENSFVLRAVIPGQEKRRLIEQLDKIGINEKFLFPGLDGIGKYINTHYKNMRE